MANNSGVYPLQKQIQNSQTTSSNYDDSHIICGQISTQPSWLSTDIHVKGNLIFEPPYTMPSSDHIIAQDSSCSVTCNNGSIISSVGAWGDMQMYENMIQSVGQTNLQWFDQQLLLNTPYFSINQQPSSQYFIVYGQAKGEGNAQQQYHIPFPDADVSQPDFDLKMWGFPDAQLWFDNDQFNQPDNSFLVKDGDSFRLLQASNYMVEITIKWQLLYTFDGANPSCYVCCGLFNRDSNEIVPQSLSWYNPNDVKHKYLTMTTTFVMRCDSGSQAYFPFFQQQNDGGFNQFTNTEISGRCRSSIQFKFYQFVQY